MISINADGKRVLEGWEVSDTPGTTLPGYFDSYIYCVPRHHGSLSQGMGYVSEDTLGNHIHRYIIGKRQLQDVPLCPAFPPVTQADAGEPPMRTACGLQ